MITYKGFTIWYNEIQHRWLISHGDAFYGLAKTLGAAKRKVTMGHLDCDHKHY